MKPRLFPLLSILLIAGFTASACQPQAGAAQVILATVATPTEAPTPLPETTPFPTRPPYQPGELVDYIAQTGDTLPGLAAHFNTSVEEIREANPIIPEDATTMPPGMPMKIPIYFAPLWGSPFQIIPDSQFINGPAVVGFDTQAFIDEHPGWLKDYSEYAADATRRGGNIVDDVALNFSVSPRLLLALLEYQSGALSTSERPENVAYALGKEDRSHRGLYMQLVWAANTLNNAFYPYRAGQLQSITLSDGSLQRPDPWQNAATIALQKYYSLQDSPEEFVFDTGPDGLARTFRELFGDPWAADQPHIPGSLRQPDFVFPFELGTTWAFTGGPHTGWGTGEPLAALDFAPPSIRGGCVDTEEWVTAVAPGVIARSEEGIVVLDLDGDGNERTGWVVFHLHVATKDRAMLGKEVQTGDPLGHPSCERGNSTGTHVHLARKYNGEWMPAEGALAFNFEGWIAHNGAVEYQGTMTRFGQTVTACVCSNAASFLTAGERK